ncbi:MAG: DUF359 domain-containing protein [Candidatus Micrarchaeota archaeon]|nr:DUF359 domain-containing protein [Candidatus Micrarchaeota archaeon]
MLILPEKMRAEVRKPFGHLYDGKKLIEICKNAPKPLIAVGDQCTFNLIAAGVFPDILIFDFKIKRVEIASDMKKAFAPHAKNAYMVLSAPSSISDELMHAVTDVLKTKKGAIFVVGEDDLSSLLVMAEAKAGTLVYGQPDEGAVVVALGGKEIIKKAKDFLDRMEKHEY